MHGWVVSLVISFVIRQLGNYLQDTNWDLIKMDLHERVRKMVPGGWFDESMCHIVDASLDSIRCILSNKEQVRQLLTLLAGKKFDEACSVVQDLLSHYLKTPHICLSTAQLELKKMISEGEMIA